MLVTRLVHEPMRLIQFLNESSEQLRLIMNTRLRLKAGRLALKHHPTPSESIHRPETRVSFVNDAGSPAAIPQSETCSRHSPVPLTNRHTNTHRNAHIRSLRLQIIKIAKLQFTHSGPYLLFTQERSRDGNGAHVHTYMRTYMHKHLPAGL